MAKQVNKLKMIAPNKTVVFWSPTEGDDVLVRTGTIPDGSCCFHSLLYGYSKEYVSMDDDGRKKFVRRLRASMAGKVSKQSWEEIGGGLIAKIPFQENVNYILLNVYRFLTNDKSSKGRSTKKVMKKILETNQDNAEVYILLTELIPFEKGFEQNILPEAYAQTEKSNIDACKNAIVKRSIRFLYKKDEIKALDQQRAKYIENCLCKLLKEILDEAEESAFQSYVKGLENVTEEVDLYTIGLISDRFNRDIYFIDGKTRLPYNNSSTSQTLKGRKSLIVLWIGDNHYEIVGRLLPGNRIQREFSHTDPLIQKLYTFLVNPSEIPKKYPELNAYLPKEYRVDSNQEENDSDNDDKRSRSNSDMNSSDEDDDPWNKIRDSSSDED